MNCQSRNVFSCINLPTRVTESSSKYFWCFTNPDITDHFPVFVCYPGYSAPNEGCQVKYRF